MRSVNTTEAVSFFINSVFVASTLTVSLVAPNAVQVLGPILSKRLDKTDRQKEARRLIRYMKQKEYIEVRELDENNIEIRITAKGKSRYKRFAFQNIRIKTPTRWDGKWRVVAFDIPLKYRAAGSALTLKLKNLGFRQLQRSVWVHPFPCSEEIQAVASIYEIAPFITYMEVESIDSHNKLVQQFSNLLS